MDIQCIFVTIKDNNQDKTSTHFSGKSVLNICRNLQLRSIIKENLSGGDMPLLTSQIACLYNVNGEQVHVVCNLIYMLR